MKMSEHNKPQAESIVLQQQKTEPYPVSVGMKPEDLPSPNPNLNGSRIQKVPPMMKRNTNIYLADQGVLRRIPGVSIDDDHPLRPYTYNNLFRGWSGIVPSPDDQATHLNAVDELPHGLDIAPDTILARGVDYTGAFVTGVFFIEHGYKRVIKSPAVMDKYYFAWDRVYNVPAILLHSIPDGPEID
jgi:hypothetical protein